LARKKVDVLLVAVSTRVVEFSKHCYPLLVNGIVKSDKVGKCVLDLAKFREYPWSGTLFDIAVVQKWKGKIGGRENLAGG
jgi:hypothetical protein